MLEWLQPALDFVRSLKWWTVVQPWQGAIHVRLGRVKRVLTPGWYLLLPILDTVWEANVLRRTSDIGPLPLTTKDGYGVTGSMVVTWEVADVLRYQTTCEDPREVIHDCASGALAHAVLNNEWATIPTEPFIAAVATTVRRACSRYGIRVVSVRWTGIAQTRPLALWNVGGHGNLPPSAAAAAVTTEG